MTRRVKTGALLVAGTLGAGAALAIASVPDGSGVIHACYQVAVGGGTVPSGNAGNVRIIDSSSQSCDAASERSLTFNQQGPPGNAGSPGVQGPPGPPGASTITTPPPDTVAGQATLSGGRRATRALPLSGTTTFPFLSFGYEVTGRGSKASGFATVKSPPPLVFVTREPDKLSQLLMQACITGEHFKKIVLATSKETLTMTDAVITSVQPTNHGGDRLDEIEHFAAQKVTMEFAAGASHTLPAIQYSSSAKTKLKFPR